MLKYPSIENHFNITKSNKIMSQINNLFYATKKINGSNIQIKLDKQGFAYFSRNRQLTDTDPFYNKLVNAGNTKKILEIAESYLKSNSLDEMYIFGELYGAGIQNMQYQENLDNTWQFRVFDVFIREDNHMRTLSQSEFYNLFDESLRVPDMNITKTLG
jgi:ATP dependent DNA ligase domain